MKLRKLMVAVFAFFAGLAQAQQMPPIPADPDVVVGKLDNGLTYYIRHNNWPENRADFYIAQKVGAIQEEESQRGLAHFLEHMCFNGTKHFPGNGVIRYCESIGVQFGRDLNAYTAIDQTVYNISNVPTDRQSALDSCLLILSDWSNALTLDPKEIDEERGVIHEEWRLRTSASSRMFERNLPKLYPGSKYGVRYPIGLMSVIDNFKPKELRDYYEKWYHPTNQAIIVVGNVDVKYTENKIKELVEGLENGLTIASWQGAKVVLNEGGSYGDLYVRQIKRDEAGKPVKNADGKPVLMGDNIDEMKYAGNMNAKVNFGWSNTFHYKDFTLSFLIDGKFGGRVLSATEATLDGWGVSERTGNARNAGKVVVDGVEFDPQLWYTETGSSNFNNSYATEFYVYKGTNVRMRELSLGYTFRNLFGNGKNLTAALIARNLFFFYKDAPCDPDVSMGTGNGVQGVDIFNLPSSRSLGLNLKLNF